MSTTISTFPASDFLPLVSDTRSRTQELFQQLLIRHEVRSTIEVKAYLDMDDQGAGLEAAADQRWYPGLDLRFEYWLNGRCDSSSWPCCFKREPGELITEEDIRSDKNPTGASPELLGQWWYIAELAGVVSPGDFSKRSNSDHYWGEYRNMGASAVASTGYGLSIAALAEATDGVIASWDSAFDSKHNGETAEQFLAWWGDERLDYFGPSRFT